MSFSQAIALTPNRLRDTITTVETVQEMHAKIVGKAAEDVEFRARLLNDPKGAIEQELSVTIPASMSIEVHEDSATKVHLTLPPDSRLSESDLRQATGGFLGGFVLPESEEDW